MTPREIFTRSGDATRKEEGGFTPSPPTGGAVFRQRTPRACLADDIRTPHTLAGGLVVQLLDDGSPRCTPGE